MLMQKVQLYVFLRHFESLQISLANGFLPVIANVGDSLAVWTGKLSALATAHPIVAQGIIYTIGTFGLLWLTFKTGRAIISGYNAFMATCALWQTTLGNCTAVLRSKTMLLAGTQRTVALATKLWSGGMMLVNGGYGSLPYWLVIDWNQFISRCRNYFIQALGYSQTVLYNFVGQSNS